MRKLILGLAASAAFAVIAVGPTPRVAVADPVNSGTFGPFLLQLESLKQGATPEQIAAIDAAKALYTESTTDNQAGEIKLIGAMLKKMDKVFEGNTEYQTVTDNLVLLHFTLRVSGLGPQANLAALSGGVQAVVPVARAVAAKLKALDTDKNNTTADLADYSKNRAKFRKKELAYAKYCLGVIKRYGV